MKFEIKNKFTSDVQITAEIDCDESLAYSLKLGLAIRWAISNKADLSGADLSGAGLSRANLSDANLSRANLSDASLFRANLSDADLSRANLSGADLSGAGLSGANLSRANLSDASLFRADLSGAGLSGADLSGAGLSGANLRSFKHDFWGILLLYKNEVPKLIEFIKGGKIDGSVYSGECSCLMGTIVSIRGGNINDNEFDIVKDSKSPAESWFMMIDEGMTPENSFASKMALEWSEEFLILVGAK